MFRRFEGPLEIFVRISLIALPIYCFVFLLKIPELFGINLFPGQFFGGFVALLLMLLFLLTPADKKVRKDILPWYDAVLAILGFAGGLYIFLFYPVISLKRMYQATPLEVALGLITLLLILEVVRRLFGRFLVGLCGFFIVHALYGNYFPGFLYNRGFSLKRVIELMYFYYDGIFGVAIGVVSTIITVYTLFGILLQITGGGKIFTDMALSLVGRFRGGSAKVAVVGSGLFGMISGSPTANAAGIGMMTIPMMKSSGYRPVFAAAVEAVSSTGGQIMPPVMGSVAFLIAEYLGISYGEVVVAAAIPAILYYWAVFVQVDLEAAKTGLKGLTRDQIPSGKGALKLSWLVLVPLAVLIVSLVPLRQNASVSGIYALAALFVLSLLRKESRLNPRKLLQGFENAGRSILGVGALCAMAGILIGSITITGLGFKLSYELVNLAGGNIYILLLSTAIISTIMGTALDVIPCYIFLAALVAPALTKMGIPVLAAHLFLFYYGVISFITPPVAPAAFVTAGIAQTDVMRVGWKAMHLGIVAYIVPFFFALNQELLMMGSFWSIALAFATAMVGVFFLCVAIEDYFLGPLGRLRRSVFFFGGVALIFPAWWADLLGLIPVLVEWKSFRQIIVGRFKFNAIPKESEASTELGTVK